MFIELTESQVGTKIAININAITDFYAGSNITYIWTVNNRQMEVEEGYDVIKRTIIKMKNE